MEVLQQRHVKDEESVTKLKAELTSEEELREQALASQTVCREDLDQVGDARILSIGLTAYELRYNKLIM